MSSADKSRRSFLTAAIAAVVVPLLPFGLLQAAQSALCCGRKLVLLELAGANDGLNTVVPFRDHRYAELRPQLHLKPEQVIPIDAEFAFHHALRSLMPLWEHREIAVVHGLGYPQANRSHFKSMEIWETGGDGIANGRTGWITHDIEHTYAAGRIDAHGLSLGGGMAIFSSPSGNWLSMKSLGQFQGKSVPLTASGKSGNSALDLIQARGRTLSHSMQRISEKIAESRRQSKLRGSDLANQLAHAANLINAGIDTPVIKVSHGGFDTHENQSYRHENLLRQFAEAVSGFRDELIASGEWENTLVMTYSEFGRRARENRSGGTDHGTAAPHFLIGGALNAGQYGASPDLGALLDDDLQFTMDYRALYGQVLSGWLNIPRNQYSAFEDSRLKPLFA